MGCDGGTIPRRDELVRVKKKPEQKDKNAENAAKWKHCAISQQPLRRPIVTCELGKLYNKEAVIEHLLSKDSPQAVAKHIKSLSDVKELKLTVNNGFEKKQADKGDAYVDVHASRFVCPVSGLEMNGKQKFFCLWKCGCVLSEKAIKEVKSDVCHNCGIPLMEDDLITINGSQGEIEELRVRMEERRLKAKLEKKRKKAAVATEVNGEKKQKVTDPQPSTSKGDTHKTESKIMSKNGDIPNGIAAKKLILPQKAQPDYCIAKDPTASNTYKSLFTTSAAAKNQSRAHWVTHNPLYY